MPLTNLEVQAIKRTDRAQKVTDGDGMYVYVSPSGTKSWRLDYTFVGKRFTRTLGKYPQLTLAAAGNKRGQIKQMLEEGTNSVYEKKMQKAVAWASIEDTFQAVAEDWYNGKSPHCATAWREANKLYLERDLYPSLASIAIRDMDAKLLLAILEPSSNVVNQT